MLLLFAGVWIPFVVWSADGQTLYPNTWCTWCGEISFTDYTASNLIIPVGAFSVGHFFLSEIGVRLNMSGWQNKGDIDVIKIKTIITIT